MSGQDYEQLTLFQEDFHASHSVWLESKREKKTIVTYGLKCSELSENLRRVGSLVKTYLELLDQRLEMYYPTSTILDMQQTCISRKLEMLEGLSEGKGSLLWPRPTTGAPLCGGTGNFKQMEKLRNAGIITEEERKNLVSGNGGRSNPDLLEWLMGFPIGWTDLNASETP